MFTNRKRVVFLSICFVLIVLLSSCAGGPEEPYLPVDGEAYIDIDDMENNREEPAQIELPQDERTTLQILLDIANERRASIEKVNEETVRELAYRRDFTFYDLSHIMMSPTDTWHMPPTITADEAIADTETLFEVLRYVYGAYLYFGGDEVFTSAKERIIEDIRQDGDSYLTGQFFRILYQHLSPIIRDNHFSVGGIPFGPDYRFLVSRDIYFDRVEQRFRNRETGLHIKEIVGHDMADILRLQLDESGRHFYAPVIQREGGSIDPETLTILYEDGTSEYLELRIALPSENVFQSPSSLTHVDGYPVVSLERMMGMSAVPYGVYAHAFLSYAEELRDEPVVILDLRSNEGGTPVLSPKWMYLLTGEVVRENFIQLRNWDMELEYPWTPWGDTPETNPSYFSYEDMENLEFLLCEVSINGFSVRNLTERHIVEREQVLIVLVDRYTGSAGDAFADLAFNVENTLVIGQNTAGVLISDMAYPLLRMPNSGIPFGLGRSIHLHPEGHFAEGIGFRPDVWVTGDALAAAIAMLSNG